MTIQHGHMVITIKFISLWNPVLLLRTPNVIELYQFKFDLSLWLNV